MMIITLAYRNIVGAGLRTWLNVIALSFAYVAIIFLQGIYDGMNRQSEQATVDAWYGGGQYWYHLYDPFDPLSMADAHGTVPEEIQSLVARGEAAPILFRQASIYPGGRYRNIVLKGIDPAQHIIDLPSESLVSSTGTIPALIGSRMANHTGLKQGDFITVQWRNVHGTFDAREMEIVEVFKSTVQEIDNDQIWIPLETLRRITGMPEEATIVILGKSAAVVPTDAGWKFQSLDILLEDLHRLVKSKSIGGSIFYTVLLLLAMLAIFDTQVLSVWHRRKEMGTLMALGMTRQQLITLFTLEGAFHGLFAAAVGALYGIPLLSYIASVGWGLPQSTDDFGFALGDKIFPVYSAGLVVGTVVLVLLVTTVVSYIPTRRIASLKPTDALRGKMT